MKKPDIPENEQERLRELESYEILDTIEEKDYDNLTKIASQICGTHISLVSLIDDKRQWFKSHHGLKTRETPKDYAFCAHAINKKDEIMIVPDSREDERFHDNSLVTGEPRVIFYAGVPLVTKNGHPLGTLCVIDDKPKELSDEQIDSLKALACQVIRLLELRKAKKRIEAYATDLEKKSECLEKFARHAAHDLKSPLNNINALVEIIETDQGEVLNQDSKRMLEMISRSAKELRNLVDELLVDTTTGAGAKKLEDVNLAVMLSDIESMLTNGSKPSVILRGEVSNLLIDKLALKQVMLNLVANSVKYCDKPFPEITVDAREEDDYFRFTVEDNGPGIPEKDMARVFEMNEAGEQPDRFGEQGTGIGLAKVKKIIQDLGGKIELKNGENGGANFRIDWPKNE